MAQGKVLGTAVYLDGKLYGIGDKVTAAQAKRLRDEGGWADNRADLWEDGDEEPDAPVTPGPSETPKK
jgi:hypothetical protein